MHGSDSSSQLTQCPSPVVPGFVEWRHPLCAPLGFYQEKEKRRRKEDLLCLFNDGPRMLLIFGATLLSYVTMELQKSLVDLIAEGNVLAVWSDLQTLQCFANRVICIDPRSQHLTEAR